MRISIPGYENIYEVDNKGNVYSLDRYNSRGAWVKGRRLKPLKDKYGYYRVNLSKNGKIKQMFIHRLILLTFKGKSNLEVNHINGIKTDNSLKNLEYVTTKQNAIHARKLELNQNLGINHYYAKLTENQVIDIRSKRLKQKEFSVLYNISQSVISKIQNKKIWKSIKEAPL